MESNQMDCLDCGESVVDLMVEAEQSLREVSYALSVGVLSKSLPSSPSCAYMNLTTKESKAMTVRLSLRGFEVSWNGFRASQQLGKVTGSPRWMQIKLGGTGIHSS